MVRIEIPLWLAKAENLPRVIEGEVKAETKAGILIAGTALVEPATHCLKCGRELTNPVSRVVGIGPECCARWGIPRPDYEDAKELTELLKQVTKFERWFPKSRITIIGEYKVPIVSPLPRRMVWDEPTSFRLYVNPSDSTTLKEGIWREERSWNPDGKYWRIQCSENNILHAIKVAPECTDALQEMLESLYDTTQAPDVQTPVSAPAPLQNSLFPHQVLGVDFMTKVKRCILGDEMGLGKTVQAITAAESIAKRTLVVVPSSLKLNWRREIHRWAPGREVVVVAGDKDKRIQQILTPCHYLVINYEAVRIHKDLLKTLFDESKWDLIVVDEAHRIKNRKAKIAIALKELKFDSCFLLTGTPMLNKPDELWSLLNMLSPKVFRSYWKFCEKFLKVTYNGFSYDVGGVKDADGLRRTLAPLMLRRLKSEVWHDMPSKTIVPIYVELEGTQRKLYNEMQRNMQAELGDGTKVSASIVLAQLLRLKQICVDHNLMSKEPGELTGAKADALVEILEGTDGKVVIFSQFKEAVDRVTRLLDRLGYKYVTLTGDTKEETRQDNVDRFQKDPSIKCFVCTTQAGGVGITLTAASVGVFLDKLWTPAMQLQAQDRLHRIGQEYPVTIYEILTQGTVEDYIEQLLAQKGGYFEEIVEGASKLRKEDLQMLLGR